MSVVSDFHISEVNGKVIFKALMLPCLALLLLFTIVGNNSCKLVDKVSDTLIFRYNEDQAITTLDPAYIKSQSELWIAGQIYNGLLEIDSNLLPSPMLAKSWEILENGLVYQFHLRTDVYFHNPAEVNAGKARRFVASDVVYSFKRLIDPLTASPGAWIFSDKVEATSLFTQTAPSSNQAFYAPNDSTFVLRLKAPNSAILSQLGTAYCYIVPKEFLEKDKNGFARHPVGTGPFFLKYWEEDVKMVLRKNPQYFEYIETQRLPFLEAINVEFLKSKQIAFMKFVAGEFDFFNGLEGSFKDELLDKAGNLEKQYINKFQLLKKPFLNTEYLGFWLGDNGVKVPMLHQRDFRRALNLAIDRNTIIRYLRNGLGDPGVHGFVPPVLNQAEVTGFEYNPVEAAIALEKAGYKGGKGLPELVLTTTADYLDIMVYVKKYWEALGIKVKIDIQTGGMLRQLRNKGELPVFRGSWYADYGDPENFLACFYSGNFSPGGPNYTHYSNAAFDELYEKIVAVNPGPVRSELVAQADSLLINDAPVVVLYYDKSLRLYQNNVKGLSNDPSNRLILKRVRKVLKTK